MPMPKGLRKYWATHKRGAHHKKRKGVSMSRNHSRGGFQLPLSVMLGFVPITTKGYDAVKANGVAGFKTLVPYLVPYNPSTNKIDFSQLGNGLYPILAGLFIHKVASMVGINRALSAAKIPFIRI